MRKSVCFWVGLLTWLVSSQNTQGQGFLWEMDFAFRFDNREYAHSTLAPSLTHFGVAAAPRIGYSWNEGHTLFAGADLQQPFGMPGQALQANWLMYYEFQGDALQAQAGIFPRNKISGDYPHAFFDESQFFDTALEGLRLHYAYRPDGFLEFVTDWNGCKYEHSRERFRIFMYGKQSFGEFFIAVPFLLHHYANSDYVRGVVDNIWIYPHLGWHRDAGNWQVEGRLGWLKTFQNDRRQGKGYTNPGGLQAELSVQYGSLKCLNSLYFGENLLPYYQTLDAGGNAYADRLYLGNAFYRTNTGFYDQLELRWEPIRSETFQLAIRSIHHFTGKESGWQQLVTLQVNLSSIKK